MSIQTGERLPQIPLQRIGEGIEKFDTAELTQGTKLVLFAVPGAFTPTCSEQHLPGFVQHFDEFREKGIDVACLSVNDPFVMQAWAQTQNVPQEMIMLADGNGEFTRALGLELDATAYGMGRRAKRFALYVEDGVVKQVHVEAPGELRVSTAEFMLAQLNGTQQD